MSWVNAYDVPNIILGW